jgi:hypothetical protein
LDGNKTILPAQNTTLTGLTTGTHSLTVATVDLAGNPGYTNYVKFNVIQPTQTLQPIPTPTVPEFSSWTILILLSIVLATAGLLVYHKRKAKAVSPEVFTWKNRV